MLEVLPSHCAACQKPLGICVCTRLAAHATRVRVLILQHPQEQDFLLGSAPLVERGLVRVQRAVGLSWGSLSHALGEDATPARWCVLYPASLKRPLTPQELAAPSVVLDAAGRTQDPSWVDGIVVLDGTWSQAKALWWRNPWLLKLGRLIVQPREPSIYGKLRREPRRAYVSTVESVGLALTALGEDSAVESALRRAFRTMVQRVRDAQGGSARPSMPA